MIWSYKVLQYKFTKIIKKKVKQYNLYYTHNSNNSMINYYK